MVRSWHIVFLFVCLFNLGRWSSETWHLCYKRMRSPPLEATGVVFLHELIFSWSRYWLCVCFSSLNRFSINQSCVFPFGLFPKLVWSQRASHMSPLLLLFFLLPSLRSLFSSSFRGSCQCLISVTGQCCRAQVALCACACVCVTVFDTVTFPNVWPSTLCLFRLLVQTAGGGIRGSVCMSVCESVHLRHTPCHNTDGSAATWVKTVVILK